ncbi:uncharacterized protein LOC132755875 [Ruditapes philippinarum]|uniref:uncharacterized protein LOC132755875 n=1 Tax=Ruditapes philippinarum TaxID=129788 RepID=UPI00295A7973|nr:uncharacterized protein LOC132755875 [Ruditapes philippinarum]
MGNVHVLDRGLSKTQVPYHLMRTPDLYEVLDGECSKTLRTIRSLQRDRRFDNNARSYICQMMKDLENKIHIFNEDMMGPASQSNIRQADSEEIQHLRTELNRQMKENERLRKAHKDIEAVLSQTVNETKRNDSHQAQQGRGQEQSKQETHKKGTERNTDQCIKELQLKVQNQEDEITFLIDSNKSAMKLIDHLKGIEKELEGNLNALNHEKQALIQRLSKVPEQHLVVDNPAIAELSDPNRPQKLGEFYSELYDNEWTDAFDAITMSGYDEKDTIVTLQLTLINVLEFCNSKSSTLLKKTEEAVNFLFKEYIDFQEKKSQKHLTIKVSQSGQWLNDSSLDCGSDEYVDVQEKWKPKFGKMYREQAKEQEPEVVQKSDVIVHKLKDFRREVAESMVPIVQKAYISASWKNEYILELKPFIKKCIFLGWMMVVQSPPMCLATCKEGERFDSNIFKVYTKSGPTVDFVVWPALYLHENGPLIGKGVAEARK